MSTSSSIEPYDHQAATDTIVTTDEIVAESHSRPSASSSSTIPLVEAPPRNADGHDPLHFLTEPSEISVEEYQELLQQIRSDFSLAECQHELLDAARFDDVDVVRALLLTHGRPAAHTDSTTVVENGTEEATSSRPDVEKEGIQNFRDPDTGNTALHMAAANGHDRIVEMLFKVGAQSQVMNHSGNLPLHWAAAQGHASVVKLLLYPPGSSSSSVDVLQRNHFGRSVLTEGFASQNTTVVQLLLEHESASEERLMQSSTHNGATPPQQGDPVDHAEGDTPIGPTLATRPIDATTSPSTVSNTSTAAATSDPASPADSVTHHFVLGLHSHRPVAVQARELPMAQSDQDTIVAGEPLTGAAEEDTTGLGIWPASLVCAQWMAHLGGAATSDSSSSSSSSSSLESRSHPLSGRTILELGAGCGLPSLALYQSLSSTMATVKDPATCTAPNNDALDPEKPSAPMPATTRIYATDLNPRTVGNLEHNCRLNLPVLSSDQQNPDEGQRIKQEQADNDGHMLSVPPEEPYSRSALASVGPTSTVSLHSSTMNWQDPTTWPIPTAEVVIGSDLIYQMEMGHLLVETLHRLLPGVGGRFYYVAPESGRAGQEEFLSALQRPPLHPLSEKSSYFHLVGAHRAPPEFVANPLANQDDEELFLYFNELMTTVFYLYEFEKRDYFDAGIVSG